MSKHICAYLYADLLGYDECSPNFLLFINKTKKALFDAFNQNSMSC